MLNFIRNCNCFPNLMFDFTLEPPVLLLLHPQWTLYNSSFNISAFNKYVVISHCDLIFLWLMRLCIFSCAYDPSIQSSLVKCLMILFVHNFIELFIFLLLTFRNSLYILEYKSFVRYAISSNTSSYVGGLFIFLT